MAMHEILADIVRRKRLELAAARKAEQWGAFKRRLLGAEVKPAIIAEIKLASPTHPNLGFLTEIEARARNMSGRGRTRFLL